MSELASDLHRIFDSSPGWSTIVSAAHATYTAPNEIVDPLQEAAQKNQAVAGAIKGLVKNWSSMSPGDHATAARDLLKLGEHTSGVEQAAKVITDANTSPQRMIDGIAAWSKGNTAQRFIAWAADSPLGKAIFNRTINQMPGDSTRAVSQIADDYASRAAEYTAKATAITGKLPLLKGLGTTVGDVSGKLTAVPGASLLEHAKVLSDIPVVGVAISTLSAGYDIGVDHENPAEAFTKEYTGTVAGQFAYNGTRDGLNGLPKVAQGARNFLTSGEETAAGQASDTAAATAAEGTVDVATAGGADAALATAAESGGDAIAATGPAGWAVAGGVAAAVAVGYAATKFVEGGAHDFGAAVTKGGGEMVDGIAHGNLREVGNGAETVAKDVGKGFVDGGKSVAQGFEGVGKSIGGVFSSII
jgi:hypothetical protein